MIQALFKHAWENGNKYNPLALADTQLRKLRNNDLISSNTQAELENAFVKIQAETEGYCKKYSRGIIPFILCPNPNLLSLNKVFKKINVGGNPDKNTFFLKHELISDLSRLSDQSRSRVMHAACGIEIGIQSEPETQYELKKVSREASLEKIQYQSMHEARIMFSEAVMLSFYYPDIYDIWDGIEALGSLYDKKQFLRLYWLNNKSSRYLKVAREDSALFDSRFVSPRVSYRSVIQ